MGAQQSKDELLYQQVDYGNAGGIAALHRDGAGLEWIDKEGKTPLILASMRPDLLHIVKVLIDLGAKVNAYRPGSHAGTPLHHAAKRGLVHTVDLLLSHGANPLAMNDDCQTALDLARAKGHWNVVRLIETRICLFSGWLREVYGPSILEAFVKNWVSRKIWAVVLPCDYHNPMRLPKYEIAIYSELQVAQPSCVIPLWKAHIEEPMLNQLDPALVVLDKSTKKRYKFLSEYEGDKRQLQLLYNACRGISQPPDFVPATPAGTLTSNASSHNQHHSATSAGSPKHASEDVEFAMAINASIQSAIAEGVPVNDAQLGTASHPHPSQLDTASAQEVSTAATNPSAPPMVEETFYAGPIQYPSIDSSLVDLSVPAMHIKPGTSEAGISILHPIDLTASSSQIQTGTNEAKEGSSISGSCVICLDAPVEGACIPCGHVVGCMSCLKEIKGKKWGCPVCRGKIDQVIKLYAV